MLNGFKSFYSRTEIDLKEGIIGIVGPNGCGKSNIYDAVQWVLGEQSAKQLRGDEISDVIARGNVRRGEKQSAEAYLTFRGCGDVLDTNRDEIEVGRRVETDGTGTYFLNGDEVRLKDVQDLFRDTGIGQDLYSSIGQGEVLKLIDSKPEERREIIEEAAGIASYRHRRDLTRRRLKQTRTELEQVEQELQEKQGRLSQLRGQADQAERVKELQSRLRQLRIERAKRKYREFEESLEAKQSREDELSDQVDRTVQSKNDVLETKTSLQSVRREVTERKQRLDNLRDPTRRRRQELREKQSEYRARIQSLRDQRSREEANRGQLERQLRSERDALVDNYSDRYRSSLRETICDSKIGLLEAYRSRKNERRKSLEQQREDLRDRTLFHRTEAQDLQRKKQSLRNKQTGLDQSLNSLRDDLRSGREKQRSLLVDYRDHFEKRCYAASEMIQETLKLRVKEREQRFLKELLESRKNTRRTRENELERLKKDVSALKSRIQSGEDLPAGVRDLLEAEDEDAVNGLRGVLGDMIDVEGEYEAALQAALRENLHDLIVESFSDVPDLLGFVRDRELDSVTLRPRDLYEGSEPPGDDLLERDGVLARAADLVEYEAELTELVESLLGRTYIVRDRSNLLEQLREDGFPSDGVRLITTGGEVLGETEGIRCGNGRRESRLQRRRKIEELEAEGEKLSADLDRIKSDVEHYRKKSEIRRRQIDQLKGNIQGLRDEHRSSEETVRDLRHRLERSRQRINEVFEDITENRREKLSTGFRLAANRTIEGMVESIDDKKGDEIDGLQDRIDLLDSRIEELRSEQRQVEQRRSVARSRRQESDSRIKERTERIDQTLETIRENEDHVETLISDQFDTSRRKARGSVRLSRLNEVLSVYDDLKSDIQDRETDLQEKFETVNSELREQEKREEKLRGQLDKVSSELSNQEARFEDHRETVRDELEVTPVEQIREYDDHLDEETDVESLDRSELTDEIRDLKADVRNLKPVNMLAKEEADDLEQDVEQTRDQYEDLQTSCDKLESLIGRLNDKARNQFLDAFSEIQGYFEEFVAELFQGGSGSIELTEGPVLEAGVEIEIEPPGEQLRTMSALSGGEKTLGALAFLFALFERKSSPFCFLDEVDHPLDDENVNQFIQLISRYREDTQFIIITHNKLTMQATDRLFGVTMEESGVTSIVPMELEEAESLREPQEV